MAGTRQIFLEKDAGIAERRLCFALGFLEPLLEFSLTAHHAHSAAAAAHSGFYNDRVADGSGEFARFGGGAYRFFRSRKHRYTRRIRQAPCGCLVAEEFEKLRCRADKRDAALLALARKCRILGQEAVA